MMRPRQVILASLLAIACNQGGGSSGQHDAASPSDAQSNYSLPEIPPGCPPSAGNENGIGAPCTKTGNECTGSLKCSCQNWFGYPMPASMPCFCTGVSTGTACAVSCGSNASCCTYNVPVSSTTITISACFPGVCAPGGQCPSITP